MTHDVTCTCATCARQCKTTHAANICEQWRDPQWQTKEQAIFSALRANDKREMKEKGYRYYEPM